MNEDEKEFKNTNKIRLRQTTYRADKKKATTIKKEKIA